MDATYHHQSMQWWKKILKFSLYWLSCNLLPSLNEKKKSVDSQILWITGTKTESLFLLCPSALGGGLESRKSISAAKDIGLLRLFSSITTMADTCLWVHYFYYWCLFQEGLLPCDPRKVHSDVCRVNSVYLLLYGFLCKSVAASLLCCCCCCWKLEVRAGDGSRLSSSATIMNLAAMRGSIC